MANNFVSVLMVFPTGEWVGESNPIIWPAVAFPLWENCNEVVVSVSIDFPSNSKRHVSLYYTAFDYSHPD